MANLDPKLERLNKSTVCFKASGADFHPFSRGWRPKTHRHAVGELFCCETEAVVLGLQPSALCL